MANTDSEHPDPEDMFNETRMSFGDHIGELRTHLLRALKGFVIGMIIGLYPLGSYVVRIIVAPVEEQLAFFEKRVQDKEMNKVREDAKRADRPLFPPIRGEIKLNREDFLIAAGIKPKPPEPLVLRDMEQGIHELVLEIDLMFAVGKAAKQRILAEQSNFVTMRMEIPNPEAFTAQTQETMLIVHKKRVSAMNITEAFMVYFKVAMMTGFVISSPWVFYHVWAFIAAGLYPHEKRLVNVYLPFSLFLFLSGVFLCQFAVMPKAIEALLWFNEWLGINADLRLNEWLGFALMMPIVFGISFQTPLVMMFLHKVGILSVQIYRDYRRIAWMVMAIFAAVITPSVDAFSMLFLWVPMGLLYELGIWLCVWQGQRDSLAEWEQEEKQNELVEV